jgi:hypothetical protein
MDARSPHHSTSLHSTSQRFLGLRIFPVACYQVRARDGGCMVQLTREQAMAVARAVRSRSPLRSPHSPFHGWGLVTTALADIHSSWCSTWKPHLLHSSDRQRLAGAQQALAMGGCPCRPPVDSQRWVATPVITCLPRRLLHKNPGSV